MIMRRAQTDPSAAISQLTRDMARIRADIDNIRTALASRGRRMWHDTTERMSDSTTEAMRQTGSYIRQHPAAMIGVMAGIAALVVGIVLGFNRSMR